MYLPDEIHLHLELLEVIYTNGQIHTSKCLANKMDDKIGLVAC